MIKPAQEYELCFLIDYILPEAFFLQLFKYILSLEEVLKWIIKWS
jgi:hypothetical protein